MSGNNTRGDMRRLLLVATILAAMGCGSVPEPADCDDEEYRDANYRECVGPHEYQRHKERVIDMVKDLREVSANPVEMADTAECDELPTNACRADGGPICVWAAKQFHPGEGVKYHAVCICVPEDKRQRAMESCDGI